MNLSDPQMAYLIQLYFMIKLISENHPRSAFKVYPNSDFNMRLVQRLVKKFKKIGTVCKMK